MFYKICNLESSLYCDLINEEQTVLYTDTLSSPPPQIQPTISSSSISSSSNTINDSLIDDTTYQYHVSTNQTSNLFGTDIDTTDWNESELEMIYANTSTRHGSYHHLTMDLTLNTGLPTKAALPTTLRQTDGVLINETAQLPINSALPITMTAGSNVLSQSAINDASLSSDMRALETTCHMYQDKGSEISSHSTLPPLSHSSSRSSLQRQPFKSLDLGFDTSGGTHIPLMSNDRPNVLGEHIPVDRRIETSDRRLPVLLERGVKRGLSTHTGLSLDSGAPSEHRPSLMTRGSMSLEKELSVNRRTQSNKQSLFPPHIRYGVATRVSSVSSNTLLNIVLYM